MKPTIDELAIKYRTDKTPSILHGYAPFYQELFGEKRVRKLLEIGIGYPETMPHVAGYVPGASHFMWEEFFPEAEIYAADIRPDLLINRGRIRSAIVDQGSLESLLDLAAKFGEDFDIIIDDGSHIAKNQSLTARALLPSLARDGIYIVEDVIEPDAIVSVIPKMYSCRVIGFDLERCDNDRLVVIQASTFSF